MTATPVHDVELYCSFGWELLRLGSSATKPTTSELSLLNLHPFRQSLGCDHRVTAQ